MVKGEKKIPKGKEWPSGFFCFCFAFFVLQGHWLNCPPYGHGGWRWYFILLLFLALKGLGWDWGSLSLLPKGLLSAPVTILWLPRASLNCDSCREWIAWTWRSPGWPPGHSLRCRLLHWLLPHCSWGGSMSVWLHWWIAVGSNRNPFQEDRGFFPGSLAMTGKEERVKMVLKLSPNLPPHAWAEKKKKKKKKPTKQTKTKIKQGCGQFLVILISSLAR